MSRKRFFEYASLFVFVIYSVFILYYNWDSDKYFLNLFSMFAISPVAFALLLIYANDPLWSAVLFVIQVLISVFGIAIYYDVLLIGVNQGGFALFVVPQFQFIILLVSIIFSALLPPLRK